MAHDHDFIKRSIGSMKPVLDNGVDQLSNKEWQNIVGAFGVLHESLGTHIQLEDNILFEKAREHAKENTLFYSLIAEHLQIMELLKECSSELKFNDRKRFSLCFDKLTSFLEQHAAHEEALMSTDLTKLEESAREIIIMLRDAHIGITYKSEASQNG